MFQFDTNGEQTTAVGSLLVGSVISKIEAEKPGVYKPEEIAHALSFLAGAILFVLGILRLGWLIEFIPYVSISWKSMQTRLTVSDSHQRFCHLGQHHHYIDTASNSSRYLWSQHESGTISSLHQHVEEFTYRES
jgi:hypothetical protein